MVLKKILYFFLCFDCLIWTWTWLGLEPLWTWTWLGLEPLWTWTWLGLEPLWTRSWLGLDSPGLGLDKGGLDYSPIKILIGLCAPEVLICTFWKDTAPSDSFFFLWERNHHSAWLWIVFFMMLFTQFNYSVYWSYRSSVLIFHLSRACKACTAFKSLTYSFFFIVFLSSTHFPATYSVQTSIYSDFALW